MVTLRVFLPLAKASRGSEGFLRSRPWWDCPFLINWWRIFFQCNHFFVLSWFGEAGSVRGLSHVSHLVVGRGVAVLDPQLAPSSLVTVSDAHTHFPVSPGPDGALGGRTSAPSPAARPPQGLYSLASIEISHPCPPPPTQLQARTRARIGHRLRASGPPRGAKPSLQVTQVGRTAAPRPAGTCSLHCLRVSRVCPPAGNAQTSIIIKTPYLKDNGLSEQREGRL